MTVDLTTPQARMAQYFMREVKGLTIEPHDVEQLDDHQDCWYFYYDLPQGELELEVFYDARKRDWDIAVTAFPIPHT